MLSIDSNGLIYTGPYSGLKLWAIDPDGSTRWRWTVPASAGLLDARIVPRDGSIILAWRQRWFRPARLPAGL